MSPLSSCALLLAFGLAGIVGNFAGGAGAARNLRGTMTGVVALLASAILLLPLVRGHLPGVTILLVSCGLAFGAMPVTLQLWVFKAAPEALEGCAALLVSTFQIFIAFGLGVGRAGGRLLRHISGHVRWRWHSVGGSDTRPALATFVQAGSSLVEARV